MRSFAEIYDHAIERHGLSGVEDRLISPTPTCDPLNDAAWLEEMARCIFQAGFSWKVINNKWPGFQAAFGNFDPRLVANYIDEDMDRLLADKSIVRNHMKIKSVVDNAAFLNQLTSEKGSAAKFLYEWPENDQASLLIFLSKNGSRLGGNTGQRLLRNMGKQSFILTRDVLKRLSLEGVADKMPTSAKGLNAVQDAFNEWSEQSGRGLSEISKVLALSVD